MTTGEKIRIARKVRGYTQQELANAVGINVQTVRNYEAGKFSPKTEKLLRLAAALDCTVFDLIEDKEEKSMSIGRNIREARKTAGLTQKELSELVGVATGTIQQYELDKRKPRTHIFDKLATVLNSTVFDLTSDKPDLEVNEGYEIVEAETYRTNDTGRVDRIVLGRMDTKLGVMWVTWESAAYPYEGARLEYFWGHYFDNECKARADYHRRLIEKYE